MQNKFSYFDFLAYFIPGVVLIWAGTIAVKSLGVVPNLKTELEWDIFKISHHCSYKALSDEKGKDKTIPVPEVAWLFKQGNNGGILT